MNQNVIDLENKPSYRRDIDGLRALAVLSVVIFHLNPSWLPGGYLGVDIFFVISGYLITSIIYRDISADNFSFADFYVRRIKRILPVFFVALAVGIGLAYSTFLYDDAFLVGHHAKYAIAFASNVFSARSGGGYFDPASEEKVFLHIWSLSVEEQFYFVFPILLIFLLKFECARKYTVSILLSIAGLILLSAFVPYGNIGLGRLDVYYLPHLRFIEMLVGSLLAIALARGIRLRLSPYLSLCAIVVLVALFFIAGSDTFKPPYFPGVFALLPCVATAVILYPWEQPTWVSRFLSLEPVVWVGKISYSLYLWHWIVLAYIRYMGDTIEPLTPFMCIFAVLCMFALSIASYYFVEQPTRHLSLSFREAFIKIYLVPSILCLGVVYLLNRYVPRNDLGETITQRGIPKDGDEDNPWGVYRGDSLQRSAKVLVAGDSHTYSLYNFVDIVGQHEGWKAFVSWQPGCPFLFDYTYEQPNRDVSKEKNIAREQYLRQELSKYTTIVLPCYWESRYYQEDQDRLLPAIERTLQKLVDMEKEVVLVNTLYHTRQDMIRSHNSPKVSAFLEKVGLIGSPTRGATYYRNKQMAERVKAVVARYSSVRWVDLEPYLPESGIVDGNPIYSDRDHINHFGAGYLAKTFIHSGQRLVSGVTK